MSYVHGYSPRETQRLNEQSLILEELLHSGTHYQPGNIVLEPGCGVGAQTVLLARRNPATFIISMDISKNSVEKARQLCQENHIETVAFQFASIQHLPYKAASFDHIFINFVLEHLAKPLETLLELRQLLKPGGTLTAIEGDHGSCFWYPETPESRQVWQAMITVQQAQGHDPLIGRRLYPLLRTAGLWVKEVSPRWVYTDANNPSLMDGVLNKIIVPMTQTARQQALEQKLVTESVWEKGMSDLANSGVPPSGTFFYTWFKAVAVRSD